MPALKNVKRGPSPTQRQKHRERISPAIQTEDRIGATHTQAICGLCAESKHKIAGQSSLNTSNLSETAASPSVSRLGLANSGNIQSFSFSMGINWNSRQFYKGINMKEWDKLGN